MKSLILILLMASSSVFAQMKYDGNQLLKFMDGQASMQEGFAYGFISATSRFSCSPQGVTNGQLYDIVKNHLQKNPETRHEDMGFLIFEALNNAYPCKKETPIKHKKPV